jgi:hypothetical protein
MQGTTLPSQFPLEVSFLYYLKTYLWRERERETAVPHSKYFWSNNYNSPSRSLELIYFTLLLFYIILFMSSPAQYSLISLLNNGLDRPPYSLYCTYVCPPMVATLVRHRRRAKESSSRASRLAYCGQLVPNHPPTPSIHLCCTWFTCKIWSNLHLANGPTYSCYCH